MPALGFISTAPVLPESGQVEFCASQNLFNLGAGIAGEYIGEFVATADTITVTLTGDIVSGTSGAGIAIHATAPTGPVGTTYVNGVLAGALAGNVFQSSTADTRVFAGQSPKDIEVTGLTAGETFYVTLFAGGSTEVSDFCATFPAPTVAEQPRWIEERCYTVPAATPFEIGNAANFLDEIKANQLATVPDGPHVRWTATEDIILDTLRVARLGAATNTEISWTAPNGQSGSVAESGPGTLDMALGGISLRAGESADFTLVDITGGQMQLATPAAAAADGWTALQDYSSFATTSFWTTRLIGRTGSGERVIRTLEGGDQLLIDRQANTTAPFTGPIPAEWELKPSTTGPRWVKEDCYLEPIPTTGNFADQLEEATTVGLTTYDIANSGTDVFSWIATGDGEITALQAYIGLVTGNGLGLEFIATNANTGDSVTSQQINPGSQTANVDTFTFASALTFSTGDVINFSFDDNNTNDWNLYHSSTNSGVNWLDGSANSPSVRLVGTVTVGEERIVRTYADGSMDLVDRVADTLTPITATDINGWVVKTESIVRSVTSTIDSIVATTDADGNVILSEFVRPDCDYDFTGQTVGQTPSDVEVLTGDFIVHTDGETITPVLDAANVAAIKLTKFPQEPEVDFEFDFRSTGGRLQVGFGQIGSAVDGFGRANDRIEFQLIPNDNRFRSYAGTFYQAPISNTNFSDGVTRRFRIRITREGADLRTLVEWDNNGTPELVFDEVVPVVNYPENWELVIVGGGGVANTNAFIGNIRGCADTSPQIDNQASIQIIDADATNANYAHDLDDYDVVHIINVIGSNNTLSAISNSNVVGFDFSTAKKGDQILAIPELVPGPDVLLPGTEAAPWVILPNDIELVRSGGGVGFANAFGDLEWSNDEGQTYDTWSTNIGGSTPVDVDPIYVRNQVTGSVAVIDILTWAGGGGAAAFTGNAILPGPIVPGWRLLRLPDSSDIAPNLFTEDLTLSRDRTHQVNGELRFIAENAQGSDVMELIISNTQYDATYSAYGADGITLVSQTNFQVGGGSISISGQGEWKIIVDDNVGTPKQFIGSAGEAPLNQPRYFDQNIADIEDIRDFTTDEPVLGLAENGKQWYNTGTGTDANGVAYTPGFYTMRFDGGDNPLGTNSGFRFYRNDDSIGAYRRDTQDICRIINGELVCDDPISSACNLSELKQMFGTWTAGHSSVLPIEYGNQNGFDFAYMQDVGPVFQSYNSSELKVPAVGEHRFMKIRYLKNAGTDKGIFRLSAGSGNVSDVRFGYQDKETFAVAIGTGVLAEVVASSEDEQSIEHLIKWNGFADTTQFEIFPGATSTLNGGSNSGFAGDLRVTCFSYSNNPSLLDAPVDAAGINDYIHTIGEYHAALAYENGGNTPVVRINGINATFQNLQNAVDNGDGSVTLSGGGGNQVFDKLATTVETVCDVGDTIEVDIAAVAGFSTLIMTPTINPAINASSELGRSFAFTGTGLNIRDDLTVVQTIPNESAAWLFIRTLAGWAVYQNGIKVFEDIPSKRNYRTLKAETTTATGKYQFGSRDRQVTSIANDNTTTVVTGHDLTQAGAKKLIIQFRDDNNSRSWSEVSYDVEEMLERFNANINFDGSGTVFDNDFVDVNIVDPATGEINFIDNGRDVTYEWSELHGVASAIVETNAYSETEVNTGRKWVDGKDVYERAFNVPLTAGSNVINLEAFDTLIPTPEPLHSNTGGSRPFNGTTSGSSLQSLAIDYSAGTFTVNLGTDWGTISSLVWVQLYTKP